MKRWIASVMVAALCCFVTVAGVDAQEEESWQSLEREAKRMMTFLAKRLLAAR